MAKKLLFQAILSYEGRPQEIMDFDVEEGEASEASVLHRVLDGLTGRGREALRKISLCQYEATAEDHAAWLDKENGKYYFGIYKEGR